jgi:hypothetical protein
MLMIWFLGHWSLTVVIVGYFGLAALAAYRIALHAASYVEIAPFRYRSGRRGLS